MHGEVPLKRLPALGVWHMAYYQSRYGIRDVKLLDLLDYDKRSAKRVLIDEMGWRDYGGKHHESVFTRFYQGHILPTKWNIDKRKAHLSNLIFSGMGTRDEATRELAEPTYDPDLQTQDFDYVAKKLGWTAVELADILARPNVPHRAYATDVAQRKRYFNLMGLSKPARRVIGRLIPRAVGA